MYLKIKEMPTELANKIAAGEVVERPASVVKELVENSIDANSSWIKIDVKEAGLESIKVTDDGDGMSEKDCELAFLRHATSKINSEADLFHVHTLGFRGEALASISSVSKLTIKSSTGQSAGTLLKLEGGKVIDRNKSAARKGTEITVSELFFNTPARLKYMKTIHTELGHITNILNRLALSHPTIRFEATHNGKKLFTSPGTGDLLHVIAEIYGMQVAKNMLPIQHETIDFSISGYICKPEVTRASRSYMSTIVNGRYIKSNALNHAILRGYHTLLTIRRSPIVALSIAMAPILVDVNDHQTKLEVRVSKEKELVALNESMIQEKFRQTTLIPEMRQTHSKQQKSIQHTFSFDTVDKRPIVREKVNNSINDVKGNMPPVKDHHQSEDGQREEINETPLKTPSQYPETDQPLPSPGEAESRQRVPTMYPIGQLHGTYILAQNDKGLYMIDQHAAQERIKYEFFKYKLSQTDNQLQELLLPLTFEFSKPEAIFIEHHREELEKAGLFFEPFGEQTYVIRSHPTWFPKGFAEEIIREMVAQIITNATVDIETIREDAAILMSCKRSIKANHYLNKDDMFRLLEDLRKTNDPFTCPHGRPIIIHFSSYELEKMFKRVM